MRAVLERDWTASVCGGRAVLVRTLLAAVVGTIAMALAFDAFGGGYVPTGSAVDRAGRMVFCGGSFGLLGALFLATPPAVAGAILLERQRGTLLLVLASPIRPASFALAKLFSRSGAMLFFALAAAPPVAMSSLFGGVSGHDLGQAALLALAVAIECAAWALWVSARAQRLTTAVVLSYLLPPVRWAVFLAPLGLFALARETGGTIPDDAIRGAIALAAATPGVAIFGLAEPGDLARAATGSGSALTLLLSHPAVPALLAALGVAAVAVAVCGRALALEGEPPPAAGRGRVAKRILRRGSPGANPFTWKESNLVNAAAARPMYYAVVALLVVGELGFIATVAFQGVSWSAVRQASLAFVAVIAGLAALVAAVAGAATLGHEKSLGTLDLVRASPLTPREIVRGKVAGILRGIGVLLLIPTGHLAIVGVIGIVPLPTLVVCLAALVLLPAVWAAVGLAVGARSLSVRGSILRTVGLYGLFLAGLPLLGALAEAALPSGGVRRSLTTILLAACPPFSAWASVWSVDRLIDGDAATGGYGRHMSDFQSAVCAAGTAWMLLHAAALVWILHRLPEWLRARFDEER